MLDQTWREFTSPQALAAAQLWFAAGTSPSSPPRCATSSSACGDDDRRWPRGSSPDLVDDPEFPALLDPGLTIIRGLVMAIPVWGREAVEERWQVIRPVLERAANSILARGRVRTAAA